LSTGFGLAIILELFVKLNIDKNATDTTAYVRDIQTFQFDLNININMYSGKMIKNTKLKYNPIFLPTINCAKKRKVNIETNSIFLNLYFILTKTCISKDQ
jgi:hypothetical protein